MKIFRDQSVFQSLTTQGQSLNLTSKEFTPFLAGVNKAAEYSWFYLLKISGPVGEKVSVKVNVPPHPVFTRDNSLLFFSHDRWQWQLWPGAVLTDTAGLAQKFDFTFHDDRPVYLSNTVLFSYEGIIKFLNAYQDSHTSLCQRLVYGKSQLGNDLFALRFNCPQPKGRLIITTGCHPAEPDIIGSWAILEYLASPAARTLLQHYLIDVIPMENPDGYRLPSCLTANGINLYWNFRHDDKQNCPEAYHLWQFFQSDPPILYLDFHAYVHQYHRPPMPYLAPLTSYRGTVAKRTVRSIDRRLVRMSRGYYRLGRLSSWPNALSTLTTNKFNTITYTKYHFNMYEGIEASRQRAVAVFKAATASLLAGQVSSHRILLPPYGQAVSDYSDRPLSHFLFGLHSRLRQLKAYVKSYARYYLYRNRTRLYPRRRN